MTSRSFRASNQRNISHRCRKTDRLTLIFGDEKLDEELCGLKLRISPKTYFGPNVAMTPSIVEVMRQYLTLDLNTSLVDICCGPGTFALALADKAGQVIGLDSHFEAVSDARINALENNVTNSEFFDGSAEDHTLATLQRAIFEVCIQYLIQ